MFPLILISIECSLFKYSNCTLLIYTCITRGIAVIPRQYNGSNFLAVQYFAPCATSFFHPAMNYCVHVRLVCRYHVATVQSAINITTAVHLDDGNASRRWCVNGAKRADTAGGATAANPRKRREAVNLWFDTPTWPLAYRRCTISRCSAHLFTLTMTGDFAYFSPSLSHSPYDDGLFSGNTWISFSLSLSFLSLSLFRIACRDMVWWRGGKNSVPHCAMVTHEITTHVAQISWCDVIRCKWRSLCVCRYFGSSYYYRPVITSIQRSLSPNRMPVLSRSDFIFVIR